MSEPTAAAQKFSVFNHVPLGVCVVRDDYTVLFWNRCLEDWTRIPASEILGRGLGSRFPHLNAPHYQSRLNTIFQGGPPAIFSSQLHRNIFPCVLPNGGMRIHHTTVTAMPADDEKTFNALWVMEDVTELARRNNSYRALRNQALEEIKQRKITEQELRSSNKKLLEQQKSVIEEERLKALLQMAGATAHELNQPLMALLGNLEIMKMMKGRIPDKFMQHMDWVEEAGRRMSGIVRKIQNIRRDETKPYLSKSIINIDQKIAVLSVETSDDDFEKIDHILKDQRRISLVRARDIASAMDMLKEETFDLIFSDHVLPDGDGLDFLRRMEKEGLDTPVVGIAGPGDELFASHMIQAGAYDYLPMESITGENLNQIIINTLEKFSLQKSIKEAQMKMAEMATRDDLTGLYNRRSFLEAAEREIARAVRYQNDLVLVMMDLDRFREVNEEHGLPVGDMILSEFARILDKSLRKSDVSCRFGGKKFAAILDIAQPDDAFIVCERIRERVRRNVFENQSIRIRATVSIGFALYTHSDPEILTELIGNAEKALKSAKKAGRDRVVKYKKLF
ncbi:MAG: diguanylate cyclase [Desulfobacterales bacterium]|nr:diguanylate cyclase [Desulfobacterales bacterium]